MAVTAWGKCRVYGTWNDHAGAMKAGTYTITVPVRVTNAADDVIVPKGKQANGNLSTSPGAPSLDLMVLSNTDPDIFPHDGSWKVEIVVTFNDGSESEKYTIDTPVAGAINLRESILVTTFPAQTASLVRGVPGGVAALNDAGQVVDASGNPVTGGVGGTTTVEGLTDATTVGKAVVKAATQADARTAIGAGTSSLALGTTSSTAKAGDYQPTAENISNATTVGRNVLKAATAADARTAIGAGTSSLAIGTSAGTAADAAATADALGTKAPLAMLGGVVPTIYASSLTVWPTKAAALTALGIPSYTGPVEWSGERVGMTRATWAEPAGASDNDYRTFLEA